jgi:hypothetical protein
MERYENIKRTSVYIPLELVAKVQESASIHRRSFNQELLWLAEEGLAAESTRKASPAQTELLLNLEPLKKINSGKGHE